MTVQLAPSPVFQGPPFGQLFTYQAGTSTPQATWIDSTQTTQNTNPVILNAIGQAFVWTDVSKTYKFILQDSLGNQIWSQDNIQGGVSFLYPQTAAETSTSLTIALANLTFSPWIYDVRRSGVVPNSTSAGAANFTALKTLFNPAVAGPTGKFIFPNTTGADIYYIGSPGSTTTCVVPIRDGCKIDLQGCTINFNGQGASATDNNSGCFLAIRDFEIGNGTIVVNWATGTSTSSGNAIQLGVRGSDTTAWPVAVWDSLLTTPMGNCWVHDLRITVNATGANVAGTGLISMIGGLQGVRIENVFAQGSGPGGTQQGFTYEFGWATSDTQPSARQTSHMHNFYFRNIQITNQDNSVSTSAALILAGAYQGMIENLSFSGAASGVICSTGESLFYRPWAGVDDITGRRAILFRGITGTGYTSSGMVLGGAQARAAGTGYLQRQWLTATNYGVRETVIKDGNMYVCTVGGTSGAGPSGTGSGITDGSVTWNYVPLTANTDLLDYHVENAHLNGTSTADGIDSSAGYLSLKDVVLKGHLNGFFAFAEGTRFDFDGVVITGAQNTGMALSSAAQAIWSPQRLKKGTIRNCYICNNGVASANTYSGIDFNFCDGVMVYQCRINADSAYNGVAETTQGNAISAEANAFNIISDGVHVGTVLGGSFAYFNAASAAANGHNIRNPSGTITTSGTWDANGVSAATTTILGGKTNAINTVGKFFGRSCLNSSTNKLFFAQGPNNTDNWISADGATTIIPS